MTDPAIEGAHETVNLFAAEEVATPRAREAPDLRAGSKHGGGGGGGSGTR